MARKSRSANREQNKNGQLNHSSEPRPTSTESSSVDEKVLVDEPLRPKKNLAPIETLKPHLLYKIVTYLEDEDADNLCLTQRAPGDTSRSSSKDKEVGNEQETKEEKQEEDGTVEWTESVLPLLEDGTVEWTDSVLPLLQQQPQQEQQQQQHQQQQQQQQQQQALAPMQQAYWHRHHQRGDLRNLPPSFYITDPDTLLNRLNTRRLYKRLKEPIIPVEDDDPHKEAEPYTYPTNMTTSEIANLEWNNIILRATYEGTEKDDGTLPPRIPCSKELLLFSPCPRSVAILASYPRSGNSLMRTMYERITLRVSGSDMRGGLIAHDLVGEAAVSQNKVQFVKTHFPERRGTPSFEASRVVLLVRNPYDALESYFNLMMTGTHTFSVTEEMRIKTREIWQDMVRKEVTVWKEFHEYWLRQDVPLLVVRYEDLIRYPYETMCRVIKFTLEVNNMHFFSQRIRYCLDQENIEKLGSYQPRSGGIGKSLKKYCPELLQEMNVGILSTMEKFEYTSLLVPNKEEWELEPLEGFGREYFHGTNNTVMVNEGPLVRTPKQRTNWAKFKREMAGIKGQKCQCPKCLGRGR